MKTIRAAAVLLATMLALSGPATAGEDDNHHPAVPEPYVYPSAG